MTINNTKTLNIIYKLFKGTQPDLQKLINENKTNTDPQFWKWVGIWNMIHHDQYMSIPCMHYATKAAQLGDIDSRFMMDYELYLNDEYNAAIPSLEKNKAALHMESIRLLAEIYVDMEKYDKAKECYLIMADHLYERGIRDFRFHMRDFKPYVNKIKSRLNTMSLKEGGFNTDATPPHIRAFMAQKIRTAVTPAECMVCYNIKPLILHDCNHSEHALCILCYCQTNTCPMCRFDIVKVKHDLRRLVGKDDDSDDDNDESHYFSDSVNDDDDDRHETWSTDDDEA